ncbi:MAG: hypothetical protein WC797_01890 [Candidatus Paceibacterota bacterium]
MFAPAGAPKTSNLVGGDRDTHGCIGSAGYTWCEPLDKCLRIWEENCYSNEVQEISYLLAPGTIKKLPT